MEKKEEVGLLCETEACTLRAHQALVGVFEALHR